MKVKNVVFSGFMAAILMSATGTANAAISVASQGYVDAKVGTATTAVTNLQQTVETNKTDAANATKKVADDLSAYEAANNQAVTGLGTRLTTAEGTISSHTSTIGEHTTAITDINAELAKMATSETVTGLTGDVSALKTQVGEGKVADRIAAAVAAETSAREGADTALQGRIDAITSDTTGILKQAKDYTDDLAKGTVATNTADIATLKTDKANVSDVYTKEAVDQKLTDYTKTTDLDAGFVSESEMTTFKSENTDAIAAAKQAGDDAQATANANKQAIENETTGLAAAHSAISQLETDLATKISAPAACETQDCVLSINKATNTISWVPLTEPVADFME